MSDDEFRVEVDLDRPKVKNTADVQRIRLQKLMDKHAKGKEIYVPEKRDMKKPGVFNPPEFIRNIWGSSAGAGSGDFHVYRGIRRREYARQKFEKIQADIDAKDEEHKRKMEDNAKSAEERTAKRRAKRQKKKAKKPKDAKKRKVETPKSSDESDSESDHDNSESVASETRTEETNCSDDESSKTCGPKYRKRTQQNDSDDDESKSPNGSDAESNNSS